jgi:hypothetical protein
MVGGKGALMILFAAFVQEIDGSLVLLVFVATFKCCIKQSIHLASSIFNVVNLNQGCIEFIERERYLVKWNISKIP